MKMSGQFASFTIIIVLSYVMSLSIVFGNDDIPPGQKSHIVKLKDARLMEVFPFSDNKSKIIIDGKMYMDIDLSPFVKSQSGEDLLPMDIHLHIGGDYYPISPDQKYIVILGGKANMSNDRYFFAIIIDLAEKKIQRREIMKDQDFTRLYGISWVSNSKFIINGTPYRRIYDIDNPTVNRELINEYGLAWDEAKNNYASVYGKLYNNYQAERHFDEEAERSREDMFGAERMAVRSRLSEAIKYNSNFVYPETTVNFRGDMHYTQISSVWAIIEDTAHPGQKILSPPEIKEEGIFLDKRYILSSPIFVGDTPWMACVEQVYPLGRYDQVTWNVLMIDAHAVDSVPPKAGAIKVVKHSIAAVTPGSEKEYKSYTLDLDTKWNDATKRLELWLGKDKKLYEFAIGFEKAADGSSTPQVTDVRGGPLENFMFDKQ